MPSERAAMIAAIRESPDDDGLRLICSDWFEEQGGEANIARAEFIRTQIRRANLPEDDPEQSELEARELRLLKRYGPVWCGSHFVFKKVKFRRGFIEYVHLHLQHFLHHRRQMLALEPVRDVRLTGWCRAKADLVRRVAACPEWQHIETLRIHHQGPHRDPRSEVVLLLESPHLTRLRALYCTRVQFDANARRRFERLPILRQLTHLRFPTLDALMQDPGEWFSDDGVAITSQWGELKSLRMPSGSRLHSLRQFSETSFWSRLTALELGLPMETREALSILRDRMPEKLERLSLQPFSSPADFSSGESFFERLTQTPLRVLDLEWVPLTPATLGRLLDGTSRWQLRELRLAGCELTDEHAAIIARSPGVRSLRTLNLYGNLEITGEGARVLFTSDNLASVNHLDLSWTQIGSEGAVALAEGCWDRLRSLDLTNAGLERDGLRTLLASPNLPHLTWLNVGGGGDNRRFLEIAPDLAAEIIRLPNLAHLQVHVPRCDPDSTQVLSETDTLPWVSIDCYEDYDRRAEWRAFAGDRLPPLDGALERELRRRW